MASNTFAIHDKTAASLLHYEKYTKTGTKDECWTRWASANEEFNMVSASGSKFLIKFDSNFSKKHLATFSKKETRTKAEALVQAKQPGPTRTEEENWKLAQETLLNEKILKTLGIRSGKGAEAKCKLCGHPKSNDPDKTGHSAKTGKCQVPACTCAGYVSTYVESRKDEGKPLDDPYAGKSAQDSSCIVLNLIPLHEFVLVVGNSIIAADPGNALADSAPKPFGPTTPFIHLKWDFKGRAGAVRHATSGKVDVADGTWCEVGAFKEKGGTGVEATWIIAHWTKMG